MSDTKEDIQRELEQAQKKIAEFEGAPGTVQLIRELANTRQELEATAADRDMWKELAEKRAHALSNAEHNRSVAEQNATRYAEQSGKYHTAASRFLSTLQDIQNGKQ